MSTIIALAALAASLVALAIVAVQIRDCRKRLDWLERRMFERGRQ